MVQVTASEEVTRERLARRAQDASEVSDADLEVYLRARETFEPPLEVPPEHLVQVVSGDGAPEHLSSTVIDRMIQLSEEG